MKIVPYRMYNRIRNLGDAINPYIIKAVTGVEPYFTRKKIPHVLGVGSIAFYANEKSCMWGTGVINPRREIDKVKLENIHALRGEYSKQFFIDSGYKLDDIPLGDPGFLLGKYYPHSKVKKRFKVCVVPHHASFDHEFYKQFKNNDDVCFFNIMTNDICELDKIAASEIVISQSLHGLIFAEAFGIPSVWISEKFHDNWKYKFLDWYSTTNEPWNKPLGFDKNLSYLCSQARLSYSKINIDSLEKVFPLSKVERQVDQDIISFSECSKINALSFRHAFDFSLSKIDELTEDRLSVISQSINEKLSRGFVNYSSPIYACIGSDVDAKSLDKIARIMDVKYKFHFASIVKDALPPPDEKVYKVNGLKVSKNKYFGSSFFIRPNEGFNINKEFLTIYI